MSTKIDIIIPIHRREIENIDKVKKRLDALEKINDIDGVTYTILGTYSSPQLTVEEIRKVIPSEFYKIKVIDNTDFENIAKQCNFKNLDHYYPITSVIFEWIVRNSNILQHGEMFHWFHIDDMIPYSIKWAQGLYKSWCEVGKPYTSGEYWHGNPGAGHGPSMGDIFSWKWKDVNRKWGGWGAYDRELMYIAFDNNLPVFPTNSSATIQFLRFLFRDSEFSRVMPEDDYAWVEKHFNGYVSIIHDKSEDLFDKVMVLINDKLNEIPGNRLIKFDININKNWCFDSSVYVGLKRRTDRKKFIDSQLNCVGIKSQYFEAIEPPFRNGFHSKGAYGCLLSHWNIIKELQRQNIQSCLIFEDDVYFDVKFLSVIESISQELPKDWGILYFWKDGRNHNECTGFTENLDIIKATACTHAYAINYSSYKIVLDTIEIYLAQDKKYPIDDVLNHLTYHKKISAYSTKENLVHQEQGSLSSDIKTY